MEILNIIDPIRFRTYMLVLMRISVILYLMPVFSSEAFPNMLKTGLAMVVSLALYTVVTVDLSRFPMDVVSTGLLLGGEVMIGMTLGLCIRIFLGSVQLAGQVIGFQMGFAMINVVDPQTGSNVSIMDQLGYWVCLITFLAFNGHHVMLTALVDSFDLVPMGFFALDKAMLAKMTVMMAHLFALAVKIGAPVIAALIFVSAGFGLIAKFSPQMNVMIVAFPLKIIGGLVLFALSLEIIVRVTRDYVQGLKQLLMSFLYMIGGG